MMTRKLPVILFLLVLQTTVVSEPIDSQAFDHKQIDEFAASIFHELVEFRRDIYDHPELAGNEKRTAMKVSQYLNKLGLEVKTNVGGHGIVAILKGAKPGKHIAWRADLDAAIENYYGHTASAGENEPLVKHVCGHDIHTSVALGIARTLAQHKENLTGTVSFIFQPAEETQEGAKAMIKEGLFEMIKPDEIYAAHVGPNKVGTVWTMSGNQFTDARTIRIEFDHVKDIDDVVKTLNVLLQDLTRKPSDGRFDDLRHLVDPVIGLSNPDTIYKDYVIFDSKPQIKQLEHGMIFQTQLYTTNKSELNQVFELLKQKVSETQYSNILKSLTYIDEREGVNNDHKLVGATLTTLGQLFGSSYVQESYGKIPYSSEDFGHFQKTVPGVYFFLGASNQRMGHIAYPHMPGFTPDETSIQYGVSYFSSLIIERLGTQ